MKKLLAAFALVTSLVLASFAQSPALKPYIRHSDPVMALEHVRVIDGNGTPAVKDQTIIIRDGKIVAVGASSSINVPNNARRIDLTGYTAFPGIVGMHDHMYYPSPGSDVPLYPEHGSSFPKLYLAGGVTTIRTTGSVETYTDLEIKKLIDSGQLLGPKMHITGPYLEGMGAFTPQLHQLKDAADARATVEFWAAQGATSFKGYMHLTRDELKAAIDAAHARKLKITAHLCAVNFREAADLGIDDLEHGLPVDSGFVAGRKPDVCPKTSDVLDSIAALTSQQIRDEAKYLADRKVALTSTLPVFETFIAGRKVPLRKEVLEAMAPQAQTAYLAIRTNMNNGDSNWGTVFQKELEFEREFVKAGGLLLAGLDPTGIGGVIAGYGDQREIELLVEAGFTPVEAIKFATRNGAEFLGELDRIGTIAAGKQADIVIVKGDPSANIADVEKVELVFKDGIGFDSVLIQYSAKGSVGLH
jgi:imidazolonepropionase-like amidohydrolase